MTAKYKTYGVCANTIELEVENGIIKKAVFIGGCPGNLEGISRLVEGMRTDEAVKRLSGIRCGMKNTSCPDQLARALSEIKE